MQRNYFTFSSLRFTTLFLFLIISIILSTHLAAATRPDSDDTNNPPISVHLWKELDELARLVDISYCVDTPGIQKPFLCASHCQDFPHVELVTTWNTGPLFSDSCGYIAISHPPSTPQIIVAFRGTYSIADSIVDLSALPQPYVPYSPPSSDHTDKHPEQHPPNIQDDKNNECANCTVHSGFLYSWHLTRPLILPFLEDLVKKYPPHSKYQLTLVGHSLGGAVASLAALEFVTRGWYPHVTTFGEPRVGNEALAKYFDGRFGDNNTHTHEHLRRKDIGDVGKRGGSYKRVTHKGDPVPLLPPETLGYVSHGNEIFIKKRGLPPSVSDVRYCKGREDGECSAGEKVLPWMKKDDEGVLPWIQTKEGDLPRGWPRGLKRKRMVIPPVPVSGRVMLPLPVPVPGSSVLAHRDYFWRLGLCVPGGDPSYEFPLPPWNENDDGYRHERKPEL